MKILILGASGGCGKELVQQAVARGHQVTVLVRSKAYVASSGVRVVIGEVTSESLLQAMDGQEAVLSCLGLRIGGLMPWNKPEDPQFLSRTTPLIVQAMKSRNLRRLIAVSAGGVGESRSQVPGFFRFLIDKTALKYAYAELAVLERLLLAADLDVTICRPTGLTDGAGTGVIHVATALKGRASIARADVAKWMLDELATPQQIGKTPMITTTGVSLTTSS